MDADLELAVTRMGALLLDQDIAKAAFASQQWPGWYSDSQIASEYAQRLARELAASVNAGQIAERWLAQHGLVPRHRRGVPRKRKRKKRRKARQQQQPPQQTTRPAPRQYLNAAGVTAAIYAILLAVLAALWAAAFALGWASAIALLGIAAADGAGKALEELTLAGDQRLRWILQTRMSRLERVLLQALREDWSADELAQAITGILGSLASALLAAITETTWAQNWAAYAVYKAAGVEYKHWKSRRDGLTCRRCLFNDNLGPVPIDYLYPGGVLFPPIHPRERCVCVPASPPMQNGATRS